MTTETMWDGNLRRDGLQVSHFGPGWFILPNDDREISFVSTDAEDRVKREAMEHFPLMEAP